MAVGGRLEWDEAELDRLLSAEDGPVGRYLQDLAEKVTQEAKRRAPVSPRGSGGRPSGYLRSHIGWRITREGGQLVAVVESAATTPEGAPYGLFVEVGTAAHIIRSHGDYPLRNRYTGQVFGRVVRHPGTNPQPYLRPALETIRGGQ